MEFSILDHCCLGYTELDIKKHLVTHMVDIFNPEKFREFEGDLIPTRVKQIQEQRKKENEAKLQRQFDYEKKMSEQREKVFLKFSYMFLNPNIFSNLYSNCSEILDMRNLKEQVKKVFCYQNFF